ncbi:MAG: DNA polymerase clamp loader subunit A [bacterium]
MPELKDILKSINQSKNTDLIDEYNESDYPAWVVNRAFSLYPDTILQVNELNQRPGIPKIMQYKYLLHSVRKRNRYSPWLKSKLSPDVQTIKDYYGYSTVKAKEIFPLISKESLILMKEELSTGGIKK